MNFVADILLAIWNFADSPPLRIFLGLAAAGLVLSLFDHD